jgi:hypothetical protein
LSPRLVTFASVGPGFGVSPRFGVAKVDQPGDTIPEVDVITALFGRGGDDRIFSGFASNFARQPAEQKKYSFSF